MLNKRPRTDGAHDNTQESKTRAHEDVDESNVNRQDSTGTERCRSRARALPAKQAGCNSRQIACPFAGQCEGRAVSSLLQPACFAGRRSRAALTDLAGPPFKRGADARRRRTPNRRPTSLPARSTQRPPGLTTWARSTRPGSGPGYTRLQTDARLRSSPGSDCCRLPWSGRDRDGRPHRN